MNLTAILIANVTNTTTTITTNNSSSSNSSSSSNPGTAGDVNMTSSVVRMNFLPLVEPDTTQFTTEVSNEPCGEALSSQTPSAVKLPGSLDALLYIVIVLMFYAFSIVILMVKYIRREREEASLRNYYHEFVSRDKFRSAQYKNPQFMKRMFTRTNGDGDGDTITSVESEINRPWNCRKKKSQPQTTVKNGNTFSKLRLDCDDDDLSPTDRRFTFLGARNQFCKNTHFGNPFCNKQLCSKCVSDNVPTIDWDDEIESSNSKHSKDLIEVKLHPSIDPRSPQRCRLLGGCEDFNQEERYNARMGALDNLFFPIIESDLENECGVKQEKTTADVERRQNDDILCGGASHMFRESSVDDPVIVSSCSLEVSELLANMPPLGLWNSASNDMDTLDGLSNLESETENQSLLNYSSSLWHHNDIDARSLSGKSYAGKSLAVSGVEKSDKLSDRSSLLSCSLSFDDGGTKSLSSLPFNPINLLPTTDNVNVNTNTKNYDFFKDNNKVSLSSSFSFSDKDRDKEMVRLLNDINLLADESGVFRNLKYFLRGFYKSDTEEATETSNLLPKETYFGPGSPKSMKGKAFVSPNGESNGDILSVPSADDCLYSDDVVNSLGSHWAYAYDVDDGVVSDTDRSSSFGDYCMGDTTDSQAIDLSKPLSRRNIDDDVKVGLSKAFVGLSSSSSDDLPVARKPNPMLAGYGPARKETKV